MRAAARKHNTTVDSLAELRQALDAKLAAIEDTGHALGALEEKRNRLKADYIRQADGLNSGPCSASSRVSRPEVFLLRSP